MINQAIQNCMSGNGNPENNLLLVFNNGKSICLREKINVVMGLDYGYRGLLVDGIKLPLNYFLTENYGDVSVRNKEERNL
jgi:hypothetical protein